MISYKVQTLMFEWARLVKHIAENPFLSLNGNVGESWDTV